MTISSNHVAENFALELAHATPPMEMTLTGSGIKPKYNCSRWRDNELTHSRCKTLPDGTRLLPVVKGTTLRLPFCMMPYIDLLMKKTCSSVRSSIYNVFRGDWWFRTRQALCDHLPGVPSGPRTLCQHMGHHRDGWGM